MMHLCPQWGAEYKVRHPEAALTTKQDTAVKEATPGKEPAAKKAAKASRLLGWIR